MTTLIFSPAFVPEAKTKYQLGAILCDQWGYEQTNISFYVIIKRSGNYLTVLPMKKNPVSSDQSGMSKYVVPGDVDMDSKPILKKLRICNGEEFGFPFRNYTGGGWCRLWNGKPVNETHYA